MRANDVPGPDASPPSPSSPPSPPSGPPGPAADPAARPEALANDMRGTRNQNPPGLSLLALLREDLRTHESPFAPGFVALALHRFGNCRMGLPRVLRWPFSLLYRVLYGLSQWTTGIELPYIVKVGRRVRFWHSGHCVIGALSVGDDVQFRHNVTLGLAHHGAPLSTLPVIEDRVLVGVGACVLGPVRVGHDSVLGANTVVTRDVPPSSLVGGIPGRVLRTLEPGERATGVSVRTSTGRKAA